MSEVRRRRRSGTETASNGTAQIEELDLTRSADNEGNVQPQKTIEEKIAAERSTAVLITLAAIAISAFFLYLGLFTKIAQNDVSYAVVIDAGSTGTRAQVFSFKDGALLETKMFSSAQPIAVLGFGSGAAPTFFKPLLDDVRNVIPGAKRRLSVPLALRATGGLRMVGLDFADRVIAESKTELKKSGFLVSDEWISLIDGHSEGAGAWATANFLRGHFNGTVSSSAGIMELGGASLQVVIDGTNEALAEAEESRRVANNAVQARPLLPRVMSVNVGGKQRNLVSMNRQGLGILDFRKKLYLLFDREGVLEEQNPCFRNGKVFENKSVRLGVAEAEEDRVVTISGLGNFENCVASAEITLAHYGPLDKKVLAHASGSEIYAYAYLFDRTVGLGLSESPSKEELVGKGKELCEGGGEIAGDFDEACADFSYVYLLLREITSNFSEEGPSVKLVQFINGHMLGWPLGVVLSNFHKELANQLE